MIVVRQLIEFMAPLPLASPNAIGFDQTAQG
jgi:hypothetical protein